MANTAASSNRAQHCQKVHTNINHKEEEKIRFIYRQHIITEIYHVGTSSLCSKEFLKIEIKCFLLLSKPLWITVELYWCLLPERDLVFPVRGIFFKQFLIELHEKPWEQYLSSQTWWPCGHNMKVHAFKYVLKYETPRRIDR